MQQIAARLYDLLQRHMIDPDRVVLVLRANDDQTLYALEAALKAELSPLSFDPRGGPPDVRHMKLEGVKISLASLDRR